MAPKAKQSKAKQTAPKQVAVEVVPGSSDYQVYHNYWILIGRPPTTFIFPELGQYVTPVNPLSEQPVFMVYAEQPG